MNNNINVNQNESSNFTVRLAIISDKKGAERDKEIKVALGRVIIGLIKQRMAKNDGK